MFNDGSFSDHRVQERGSSPGNTEGSVIIGDGADPDKRRRGIVGVADGIGGCRVVVALRHVVHRGLIQGYLSVRDRAERVHGENRWKEEPFNDGLLS